MIITVGTYMNSARYVKGDATSTHVLMFLESAWAISWGISNSWNDLWKPTYDNNDMLVLIISLKLIDAFPLSYATKFEHIFEKRFSNWVQMFPSMKRTLLKKKSSPSTLRMAEWRHVPPGEQGG